MRVLILTWEYPPKRIGEMSDHVYTLSQELVKRGHEVEVLAEDDLKSGFEDMAGVKVYRVANPVKTHPMGNILTSAMTASVRMEQEAADIIYDHRQIESKIDLIHAHEWLTVPTTISLKHAFGLQFVLTLHSLEGHRCGDAFGPLSIAIKEIEEMGVQESARVIVNTKWMKRETIRYYGKKYGRKISVVQPTKKGWVSKIVSVYEKGVRAN